MSAQAKRLNLVPRFLRMDAAWAVLGGRKVVEDCEAAGWLKPVKRGHRMVLYRFADIHACADRIDGGKWPTETQ